MGAFRGLSKACNRRIEAIQDAAHRRDARVSFAIARRVRFDEKNFDIPEINIRCNTRRA